MQFLQNFPWWLLIHFNLDGELESSVEEYRYVYLSVGRLLLHRVFDTREAWLAKLFRIIVKPIHTEAFVNLQVLEVSSVAPGKAVLKDGALQEPVDNEYCQL